ncbi:MAG: hypothetical protein IPM32_03275 [Ignavibacteriae bacterium]|nr:hypothetical protein [Ignavibacteriota bacterium]
MLVGIYKTTFPSYQIKRNKLYKEILDYNNIPYIDLDIAQKDFWEKVKNVDLFLYRFSHSDDDHQLTKAILPVVENYLNVKCFPNFNTSWHFDDKIREYYLLKTLGYPMIDTWIFWDEENAVNWAKNAQYPVVFKLKKGAGSTNVILIKEKSEALKLIRIMFNKGILPKFGLPFKGKVKFKNLESYFRNKADQLFLNNLRGIKPFIWQKEKNYVLFQKFLPNNSFDTRVNIIGNKAFACRRFTRQNDFRASGSGNWDLNKDNIDLRCVETAFKISKELKFQSMAYDFLMDENGNPQVCEMSWTFPDDMEQGYWDENLNWHNFKFLPPYFHLVHALGMEYLKYPEHINEPVLVSK